MRIILLLIATLILPLNAIAKSSSPASIGVWATEGKSCDAAVSFLIISDNRIVAVVPGRTITRLANITNIEETPTLNKISMQSGTEWHMDFSKENRGSIVSIVDKNGQDTQITLKQKRLLEVTRCSTEALFSD